LGGKDKGNSKRDTKRGKKGGRAKLEREEGEKPRGDEKQNHRERITKLRTKKLL